MSCCTWHAIWFWIFVGSIALFPLPYVVLEFCDKPPRLK